MMLLLRAIASFLVDGVKAITEVEEATDGDDTLVFASSSKPARHACESSLCRSRAAQQLHVVKPPGYLIASLGRSIGSFVVFFLVLEGCLSSETSRQLLGRMLSKAWMLAPAAALMYATVKRSLLNPTAPTASRRMWESRLQLGDCKKQVLQDEPYGLRPLEVGGVACCTAVSSSTVVVFDVSSSCAHGRSAHSRPSSPQPCRDLTCSSWTQAIHGTFQSKGLKSISQAQHSS